jgi:hypothetical protein
MTHTGLHDGLIRVPSQCLMRFWLEALVFRESRMKSDNAILPMAVVGIALVMITGSGGLGLGILVVTMVTVYTLLYRLEEKERDKEKNYYANKLLENISLAPGDLETDPKPLTSAKLHFQLSWLHDKHLSLLELELSGGIRSSSGRLKENVHSLYLRPFASTRAFTYVRSLSKFDTAEYNFRSRKDFEKLLAEAIEGIVPLAALGLPGEHSGAGRIKTEDDVWKATADKLIEQCIPIFVIPHTTEGTFWEIERLKQRGAFRKTIFAMPRGIRSADWTKSTDYYKARLGVTLPAYYNKGAWFSLREDGKLKYIVKDKIVKEYKKSSTQDGNLANTPTYIKAVISSLLYTQLDNNRSYLYDFKDHRIYTEAAWETYVDRLKKLEVLGCCFAALIVLLLIGLVTGVI